MPTAVVRGRVRRRECTKAQASPDGVLMGALDQVRCSWIAYEGVPLHSSAAAGVRAGCGWMPVSAWLLTVFCPA